LKEKYLSFTFEENKNHDNQKGLQSPVALFKAIFLKELHIYPICVTILRKPKQKRKEFTILPNMRFFNVYIISSLSYYFCLISLRRKFLQTNTNQMNIIHIFGI
jgi:hypothetical protein